MFGVAYGHLKSILVSHPIRPYERTPHTFFFSFFHCLQKHGILLFIFFDGGMEFHLHFESLMKHFGRTPYRPLLGRQEQYLVSKRSLNYSPQTPTNTTTLICVYRASIHLSDDHGLMDVISHPVIPSHDYTPLTATFNFCSDYFKVPPL